MEITEAIREGKTALELEEIFDIEYIVAEDLIGELFEKLTDDHLSVDKFNEWCEEMNNKYKQKNEI